MFSALTNPGIATEFGGPWSVGTRVTGGGDLVFTSGQVPVDPNTMSVPLDLAAQVHRSMDAVVGIIAAAGGTVRNIVKATIFLVDYDDFEEVGRIYESYFDGGPYPARTLITAAHLPIYNGVQCRLIIEAIAAVPHSG
jgi:2-iminobutanoate/2-iminopropanoate deaminase